MGLWRIFEIKEIDKQEQFIIEALWRWSSNFLEVKFVTFPLLQPLRWRWMRDSPRTGCARRI